MNKIDYNFLKSIIKPRPYNAHKGSMGCLFSVCGSYGMAGAEILSAKSALRSGVGLLKLAVVNSVYPIIAGVVPEAVYIPLEGNAKGTFSRSNIKEILKNAQKSSAILVGCGLGVNNDTKEVVTAILNFAKENRKPILIDADGINCISKHIHLLKNFKDKDSCDFNIVLTPHLGEMSRLTSLAVKEIETDPKAAAEAFSKEYGVITVLKGADTIVTNGEQTYISFAGNPGMATGGSGDVLAGIIASLMAQGYSPLESSAMGVFIHGTAGDYACHSLGEISMLPRDIIDFLPNVFKNIGK
ncbi:MAG: NAD(P)H-hydrate dehydratase [Oscillospiraceae bacterium]|nr:NAD(P)H-hydrate dehydratase [Oscillospiraceae bacterium]